MHMDSIATRFECANADLDVPRQCCAPHSPLRSLLISKYPLLRKFEIEEL